MKGDNRAGQSNWTFLFGPVFGTALDAIDTGKDSLKDVCSELAGGKDGNAKLVRFGRSNLPLVNLWYLRAAPDHLYMHQLQESVSPGHLRRMHERAHDEFGQDYWRRPGATLPNRAHDLAAAAGK